MRGLLLVVVTGCVFKPGDAAPNDARGTGAADAATDATIARTDAATTDASTLGDGLIAWYQMESLDAGAANDSTGNGHTGTCSACPVVVPGKLGSGFEFDGTNRIDVTDSGVFDNSPYTIATWVNYSSLTSSSFECPVGKVLDPTIYNSWELCLDESSGKWLYDTVPPANGTGQLAFAELEPGSGGPAIGTWYHTAMVWDGSNKTLYIDGSPIAAAAGVAVAWEVGMPISFGADIDNGNQSSPFYGVMDELRIYGRALGSAEIAELAAQ
jgi:hypothetical protein